jgi:methylisocitrate lyase
MAKPQGLDTESQIRQAMAEVPGPHFATLSQAAGKDGLSLAALSDLGVAGVTLPSLLLFAAARGVTHVLGRLRETGELAGLENSLLDRDDYYELVRLRAFATREREYLRST